MMNVIPTRDFEANYKRKGHGLVLLKAIELLKRDSYAGAATMAEEYILPLMLGTTWADGWGHSEFDGSQILHYYIYDNQNEGYGFGSARVSYHNNSQDYINHPFYRYGNSAEYAQDRYKAAVRAAKGKWGTSRKDDMAGWVIDDIGGQSDPISGHRCWAKGQQEIDNPPGTRFGNGQTPESALDDLYTNFCDKVPEPELSQSLNPVCSTISYAHARVLDSADDWLDDQYGDADDVEAYCGWDGHNYMYYAMWTDDAENKDMVFRARPNTKEHAYFLLGWALHLLHDSCLTIHTINSSWWTFLHHNDFEDLFDTYIINNVNLFPINNIVQFNDACQWWKVTESIVKKYQPMHPKRFYKQRWYCDFGKHRMPTIKEYATQVSTMLGKNYRTLINEPHFSAGDPDPNGEQAETPFHLGPINDIVQCISPLEFDLGIKSTAGVMLKFYLESEGGQGPKCDK